ncbi:MAG: hypothetical protein H6850_01165 [Alphaproteobacteria bacterium]|nr:MAG: hypothetical protein H6850_01165 [Alphaproteobacteria bacterium]
MEQNSGLETLTFLGCKITPSTNSFNFIQALRNSTNLRELDLRYNEIDCITLQSILSNLRYNTSLQTLKLKLNKDHFRQAPEEKSASAPLIYKDEFVTRVRLITMLSQHTALKHLSLSGSVLIKQDIDSLSEHLETNTSLRELDLSKCELKDEEIIVLANALAKTKTQRWIDVSENRFGIKGLHTLNAAMQKNPNLSFQISNEIHITLEDVKTLMRQNCKIPLRLRIDAQNITLCILGNHISLYRYSTDPIDDEFINMLIGKIEANSELETLDISTLLDAANRAKLVNALRHKPKLKSIRITCLCDPIYSTQSIDMQTFAELLKIMQENKSLQHLQYKMGRYLTIGTLKHTRRARDFEVMLSIPSDQLERFMNLLQSNPSIKKVQLDISSPSRSMNVPAVLEKHLRTNRSVIEFTSRGNLTPQSLRYLERNLWLSSTAGFQMLLYSPKSTMQKITTGKGTDLAGGSFPPIYLIHDFLGASDDRVLFWDTAMDIPNRVCKRRYNIFLRSALIRSDIEEDLSTISNDETPAKAQLRRRYEEQPKEARDAFSLSRWFRAQEHKLNTPSQKHS